MAPLDAATLAEKLSPPRALAWVDGSLFAEPIPGSGTAWLAWWSGEPASLAAVIARSRAVGAKRLAVGGPPGNYVESGLDIADVARTKALREAGFVAGAEHVDLRVSTDVTPRRTTGVTVARVTEDLDGVVTGEFGAAWGWEASRARSHGGLFAALAVDGALLGFAAHSGNLAHRGTFGPIGVWPRARGLGVGVALATAVFADLRARGFDEVTVPWVALDTAAFYESMVTVTARTPRRAMALDLSGTGSP